MSNVVSNRVFSTPLVAIIIPCYNVDKFLNEAINSIRLQNYGNFRIFCIDDGSTDQTFETLTNLAYNDHRIIVLRNEVNKGLIYTLNRLINVTDAEILVRMDPDDVAEPERISSLVSAHLESGADVVTSHYTYIDMQGQSIGRPSLSLPKHHQSLLFVSLFNSPIAHAPCLYTTKFIRSFGYSTDWVATEDYDLWVRAIASGNCVFHCVQEELYRYRLYDTSQSQIRRWTQARNHVKIARRARKILLSSPNHPWSVIFSQFYTRFNDRQMRWLIERAIDDIITCFYTFSRGRIMSRAERSEVYQYAFELVIFIAYTFMRRFGLRGVEPLIRIFVKPVRCFFFLRSIALWPKIAYRFFRWI